MNKVMKIILPIVQGFVLCAVAVQMIFGIGYICANFMTVPSFRDTAVYLQMAEHFVPDEYTGLLYPLLIKIFKSVPFIPYQLPVYVLQIAAGVFSIYCFCFTWTKKQAVSIICALWINTIPFVAQAHVTVLPHSLAMSCMIFMLLQVMRGSVYKRALTISEWISLVTGYMFLAQLTRGYVTAGTFFLIWAAALQLYKNHKKVTWCMVSLLVCLGMLVVNLALYSASEYAGYYNRMPKTFAAVFFQRVGITTFEGKYMAYMPQEITACLEDAEINNLQRYPYKIETELNPLLVNNYGKERTNEIYWELGRLGLSIAAKDNLRAIARDGLGYFMPNVMYYLRQSGEGEGATSWNYQQFLEAAPEWSYAYIRVSNVFWGLTLSISILFFAVWAIVCRKCGLYIWLPVLVYMSFYAATFALTGATDTYDYKLSILPLVLSYAPMCILVIKYIFHKE